MSSWVSLPMASGFVMMEKSDLIEERLKLIEMRRQERDERRRGR